MNYTIKVKYVEKKNAHTIEETWVVKGEKKMAAVFCDTLDLLKGKDGQVKEPDLEELKANLGKYADEAFVIDEFKRQKKCYKKYCELIAELFVYKKNRELIGEARFEKSVKLDSRTTVTVIAEEERV